MYEGTAVYVADQALLPPCSADSLDPPRIPRASPPPDCRAPNIYERDSESRLSDAPDSLFKQPWLGLTRDDNKQDNVSSMAYSSVLFWYYAQAQLRAEAGVPSGDLVKALWQTRGGNDNAVSDWAAASPFGDLGTFYHRFMVENYLQTISYPGYDNPYYDAFRHWHSWSGSGWTGDWFVSLAAPNSIVTIDPNDQVKNLALNSSAPLYGDNGVSNIEHLGTRYYTIDVDPTASPTATLEIVFSPSNPTDYQTYQVTFLDVATDAAGKPLTLLQALTLDQTQSRVFRAPNFHGPNHRVVAVVSKVRDSLDRWAWFAKWASAYLHHHPHDRRHAARRRHQSDLHPRHAPRPSSRRPQGHPRHAALECHQRQ